MKTECRMQNAECRMPRAASRIPPHDLRSTFHASRPADQPSPIPPSARNTPHSQGVALVVTLVLLSVITFMAITFLIVSHSQHGSVTTQTDLAVARFAAD